MALAGKFQPGSLVSASGLYVALISALGVLSVVAVEHSLRTAVSVLPDQPIESSLNRVEKVAHDNSTSLRRVSEIRKLDGKTPISFRTAAHETSAPSAALLPDARPAEVAYRLSIFLGGDSDQIGNTPETSPPAVAGYLSRCKTDCEASIASEVRADEPSIEAAEAEDVPDEPGSGLLDVAESVESESLADLRKSKKLAKKYAKAIGRNEVAERPKKSLALGGFSALGMAPQPPQSKSSKVQLTQIDLFTSYLIGSR